MKKHINSLLLVLIKNRLYLKNQIIKNREESTWKIKSNGVLSGQAVLPEGEQSPKE
jgi:hypothetical protein